jgi:hypothetical protein
VPDRRGVEARVTSDVEHQIAAAFKAPQWTVLHLCIVSVIAVACRPSRQSRGIMIKSETRDPIRPGIDVRETYQPIANARTFEG